MADQELGQSADESSGVTSAGKFMRPEIVEGPLPSGYQADFEYSLFNLPDFLDLQAQTGWISFHLVNSAKRRILASLHFHVDNGIARSPFRAPFGSVEGTQEANAEHLFNLLHYPEEHLRAQGVREIQIVSPPREYAPDFISLIETILINLGYTVPRAEAGAIIPVSEVAFESRVRSSELARRKQALDAGLSFTRLSTGEFDLVYETIAGWHASKGYKLLVDEDHLRKTIGKYPDRYVLSGVYHQGQLRAAAVSVRVRSDILYNFLVNHDVSYNSYSPPVILMDGLYRYCQENGIRLFDLGTSAIDQRPNFPLLAFKLHLGAVPTSKFWFRKALS